MTVAASHPGDATACPRCSAPIGRDQGWCLRCGTAARTRLAPTPAWRIPVVLVAAVVTLCLVALAWAFVALTADEGPSTAPAAQTQPAQTQPATPAPTRTQPQP